jgi:hypothetical protein
MRLFGIISGIADLDPRVLTSFSFEVGQYQ